MTTKKDLNKGGVWPAITGVVDPEHKKEIEKLVKQRKFFSVSDFVREAVKDFLKKCR